MSTNKPSFGSVVLEIAPVILRKCCKFSTFLLNIVASQQSISAEASRTRPTLLCKV